MNAPSIVNMGKFLVNTIFPFFKESKALNLIKKDMLEVSDDLFASLYDTVKHLFVKDNRKSIVSQLEELLENPTDEILQATPQLAIQKKLSESTDFFDEIKSIVGIIEDRYKEKITELSNELEVIGENNEIEQGSDNQLENGSKFVNRAKIDGTRNKVIQGKWNKLK